MTQEVQSTHQHDTNILFKSSSIDGLALKALFDAGTRWLKSNQQLVNSLNVFPVPDGDTGTNMLLTMQAACDEIKLSNEKNVGKVAHAAAHGALMGARGNSGVILSQLLRGFARALDDFQIIDRSHVIKALAESRNTAYRGVVKPVEGTILTVATDLSKAAEALDSALDNSAWFTRLMAAGEESLNNTPNLLPILKQAGVVDSGGKGLYIILEGMYRFMHGQPLDLDENMILKPLSHINLEETLEEVEEGQDYEVVVDFIPYHELDLPNFYSELEKIGTSIQIGEGDGLYRMHIHVPIENRYKPIDYTMTVGTVTKIAMENLLAQMDERKHGLEEQSVQYPAVEEGQIALIAVSPGIGFSRILASLGVNGIINGGQTMNPSTEEIVESFEGLPTDKIIILPNNKNIILAAENATHLTKKNVKVLPTRTMPQGISTTLRFDPNGDIDEVVKDMESAISEVVSGEITIATRSVDINGVAVNAGEVIGLLDGNLVTSAASIKEATLDLLDKIGTQDFERISFFKGENINPKEIDHCIEAVRKKYHNHEIEVHTGGQPYYQLILSVE